MNNIFHIRSCWLAFRVQGTTAIRPGLIISLNAWGESRNRRIKEYQKYGNRFCYHQTVLELLTGVWSYAVASLPGNQTRGVACWTALRLPFNPQLEINKKNSRKHWCLIGKPNDCLDQTDVTRLSCLVLINVSLKMRFLIDFVSNVESCLHGIFFAPRARMLYVSSLHLLLIYERDWAR